MKILPLVFIFALVSIFNMPRSSASRKSAPVRRCSYAVTRDMKRRLPHQHRCQHEYGGRPGRRRHRGHGDEEEPDELQQSRESQHGPQNRWNYGSYGQQQSRESSRIPLPGQDMLEDLINRYLKPNTDNQPKPFSHPHSGEWIRLRGSGGYLNSGIVEVYRTGEWGVICDDSWDMKDGDVACRQLGFPLGAASVTTGDEKLPSNLWKERAVLMDEIECTGTESSIQQCPYSTWHDCTLAEAAAVTCLMNTECPTGWFSGFGKCYKLFSGAKGINAASLSCARFNASLLNVEYTEENHFLSTVLKKTSNAEVHDWYTGGKLTKKVWKWFKRVKRTQRKKKKSGGKSRKAFKTVKAKVTKNSWFPGWPSRGDLHAEPVKKKNHNCLVLSDEYADPNNGTTIVDYFYWKAMPCRQKKRLNFICELPLKKKKVQSISDCYTGDGSSYRGNTSVTGKGSPCLSWADSPVANARTHPRKGLGDHNYCRNPDGDVKPWCWVNHRMKHFGFCDVPRCSEVTTPSPATATESPDLNCPGDTFYCSKEKTCIPAEFRCDREADCSFSEDEDDCEYVINQFAMTENAQLVVRRTELDSGSTEKYIGYTDERCAQKCLKTRIFVCRSFLHDSFNATCYLSSFNRRRGYLVETTEVNYYELTSQGNCDGKFVCANGFCTENNTRCNGNDDCGDYSDEMHCNNGQQGEMEVRLVGGEEHSGSVEITFRGETGVICDDEWDSKDAAVICRMLGYSGALKATFANNFEYPTEDVAFLLDDVECFGNETSIKLCQTNAWKSHDCTAYEIAGVECQVSKVCSTDQFKCKNELCVKAETVCDRQDDCGDNSDEVDCRFLRIELVNGTKPGEGRVELTRNGLKGTVCDDLWDDAAASVVCRSLGFRYGGKAVLEGYFGEGDGPVWLDSVQCSGTETSITRCDNDGWAKHDCDHSEDAGVQCYTSPTTTTTTTTPSTTTSTTTTTTSTTTTTVQTTTRRRRPSTARPSTPRPTPRPSAVIQMRLVGGRKDNEGTVEVVINNSSYRICDDYWEDVDASVVCRMMGYSAGGVALEKSFFGSDNVPIVFDNVECLGTETDITDCKAIVGTEAHDCASDELAGVICTKTVSTTKSPLGQTSPATGISGFCGYRPYDYLNLLSGNRRRRSSPNGEPTDDDYLTAPRTLAKPHVLKVVGGKFAVHGAYPWQVRVHKVYSILRDGTIYGSHACGAVIISEYWILSAAHCFYEKRKSEFQMVVGDHHQSQVDKGEQRFRVEDLILHERYSDASKDYDIALIKIQPVNGKGIVFNNFVQPACLPTPTTPFTPGQKCFISGWGNTQANNRYPQTLKAARVPLISQSRCEYIYDPRRRGAFTSRMMCAGYEEGGVDTCDGDSGGPLVCNIDGAYTLVGITSWGRGCAQPNAPGVYAKVSYFLNWIQRKINAYSQSIEEKMLPKRQT